MFHVGQKVVCVDGSACKCGCGFMFPPTGTTWTVSQTAKILNWQCINLVERPAPLRYGHIALYSAARFRPVQSTETGMEILRKLLEPKPLTVPADGELEITFGRS